MKNYFQAIDEHRLQKKQESWCGHPGCSKRQTFSPAQPRRAETRLSTGRRSKRGGEAYAFRYVEPLSAARTKLADFFNILLSSAL
jgi:hypothetical protein